MRAKQNNGGFTLVEFVITIAIASLITLAATTMLLLGLRIHHKTTALTAQQNAVSMLYSVMETIAGEHNVTVTAEDTGWCLKINATTDNAMIVTPPLVSYNGTDTISLNGTPFVSNVRSSEVTFDENRLLTISIETEESTYTFSTYCRKEGNDTEQ